MGGVQKLYASGVCNREGELCTGGKLKEGHKYILDNTHCLWDNESVDIKSYSSSYHYGIGLVSWFNDIIDLRPRSMQIKNIW